MDETLHRGGFIKRVAATGAGMAFGGLSAFPKSQSTDALGQRSVKSGNWKKVLELDQRRSLVSGSEAQLVEAISQGGDLRIYTEFRHNEHIDLVSDNDEIVQEVADFRVTYILDNRWAAGIINLRQPIEIPTGFGERPSMSFFLYNQNGEQAIARPFLDGKPVVDSKGSSPLRDYTEMPKYHQFDAWDNGTNAPSSNFAYDFDVYKFLVCDNWMEVYSNDADGRTVSGSIDDLAEAFANGKEVKVGIKGLCRDLQVPKTRAIPHEVFVHCGSCYYYTRSRQFCAASHPVVRVTPSIPLKYQSENWDFGWLMVRSDGHVARWLLDPYTLKFNRDHTRYAVRWFVR